MKKTILAYMLVAAGAIMAGGCESDSPLAEENVAKPVSLSAFLPGDFSRTAIDGTDKTKVNWSAGDKLSVWGDANGEFAIASGSGTTSASFNGTLSGTAQVALYPYSSTATNSAGTITTNIPNTQTVSEGSFDPSAAVMVGTISGTTITFHHAVAYLKITAPSDVENLQAITVCSLSGGYRFTGDAQFNASTGANTSTGIGKRSVTIKPASGTFTAGAVYYAAIIPGHFEYVYLKYLYKDGTKLVEYYKTKSSGFTVAAGHVKSLGAVQKSSMTPFNKAVQLWADGPYWATTNVGTYFAAYNSSAYIGYGYYYPWGSVDRDCGNDTDDGIVFDWTTYKWCNGSETTLTKYCTDSHYGTVDGKTTLETSDDAATVVLGDLWRMPTSAEMSNLLSNCYMVWTTTYGASGNHVGYIVYKAKADGDKGQVKYSGSSYTPEATYDVSVDDHIFLPAAGYRGNKTLGNAGVSGNYWSSSLSSPDTKADYLYLNKNEISIHNTSSNRSYGRCIRPIYNP